jgi:hypothetical protein
MTTQAFFDVIVGNIGLVYSGPNLFEADAAYSAYRRASIDNVGRAAGETVTMLKDSEIVREHIGTSENDDDATFSP